MRIRNTIINGLFGLLPLLSMMGPGMLWAQTSSIRFEHLSLDEGLSQSTVISQIQDHQGFMWFGTADGLNKYDGYSITVYKEDRDDSTSISGNQILSLYEDVHHNLWVGTGLSGLNRYDRLTDTFISYDPDATSPNSLNHRRIFAIAGDENGVLWLGTHGGGLNRFDPATETFSHYQHDPEDPHSLSHDEIYSLFLSPSGALWIGTNGGGLNRFDPATETFTRYLHDPNNPASLSDDYVRALYEDENHQLWIGTEQGHLNRLDPTTGTIYRYPHASDTPQGLQGETIDAIFKDHLGVLWIGTRFGGLSKLVPPPAEVSRGRPLDIVKETTFVHYTHDPSNQRSLRDNSIRSIYEDRSNVLWIGTDYGGLSKFDRSTEAFHHYQHNALNPNSLSDNLIHTLHEDRDGVLWIGTRRGGLNRFDVDAGTFRHYRHDPDDPSSLSQGPVRAIFEDHERTLWVGTTDGGGLNRFNRTTGTFTHYRNDPNDPQSLSESAVRIIYEDTKGTLWLGTESRGFNRFDRATESFISYQHDPSNLNSLSENGIRVIHEGSNNILWIGTGTGGLNKFDPRTETFTRYAHDPDNANSLSNNSVFSLYEDASGILWIGTLGGWLNRFDPKTESFTLFTDKDGLPNNTIYGILPDEEGNLWLSTNYGLSHFNPTTISFVNYDKYDGLQGNEFNGGAYSKGRQNILYFGGINGFNAFNPAHITRNSHTPPIVLTSVKVSNQDVLVAPLLSNDQPWSLSHNDDVLSFEFAALDFRAPAKNQYAYWLEGLDEGWIDAGTKRDVTFTTLPPRDYILHLKGSNNHGIWNEEGLSIPISIAPPYWATWWFRTLIVLSLLVLGIAAYRQRTRSIKSRNRALQNEISERKKVEKMREHLITELEAKNAELERFTYTVSHDLKSPLVTIRGFLGMLEQDAKAGDTKRLRQDIEFINMATDKMQQLLNELLELSRIGRIMNPPETVSLTELTQDALALTRGQIDACEVVIEVPPNMPDVWGDRARLTEVLQNLIDNAIKFMGEQQKPRIEIGAHQQEQETLCYVRDNGMGIESQYHDKVFGLFDRLDAYTEGTGIGLALVKRIVEVHGGRVWVESAGRGHGSTFYFTLPLQT